MYIICHHLLPCPQPALRRIALLHLILPMRKACMLTGIIFCSLVFFFPVVFVCFFWVELRPLWQMDAMFPMCFKWRARVEMWIQDKVQDFLNPAGEIKAAHFSEAFNGSEECIFPMRMTFVTFAFMFFWRVPSYSQWYMSDAGQAKLIRVSVTTLLPPLPSSNHRCLSFH